MSKFIKEIKKTYNETKKSSIIVYFILRFLVILCLILQIIRGEYNNAFLCVLSLVLFTIPFFIQKKFKIELPNLLEIIIFLFIFSAEILGEIRNFYGLIPYWDTMLHTINGFLAAGIGFSLVDLLNENSRKVKLSPIYLTIVAFCFSMTIGVVWEFFEYGSDKLLNLDMQKDTIVNKIATVELNPDKSNKVIVIDNIQYTDIYFNDSNNKLNKATINNGYLDIGINDTMSDLFVNFIGALCFSIIGYFYVVNRHKYHFASNFIPQKQFE